MISTKLSPQQLLTIFSSNEEIGEDYISQTHGFLPIDEPLQSLPESHQSLDEIAMKIPVLLANMELRKHIDALVPLSMKQNALPDKFVKRASTIVGLLTHGYVTEQTFSQAPLSADNSIFRFSPAPETVEQLPTWLMEAWIRLSRRLGRKETSLSFSDLVVNNWKFIDRDRDDPFVVENLEMLIPYTGTNEERIFYMTFIETLAVTIPLGTLTVSAQEYAIKGEIGSLKKCLKEISEILLKATYTTFYKIDPNPLSKTHADPLIWTLFVAPVSMPIRKGEVGLSGAGIPFIHLMDKFIGRSSHDSKIGRGLIDTSQYLPNNQKQFIEAIGNFSISNFVNESLDDELIGCYEQLFENYAGKRGWIGVHKLKVFGFMETGFKAGRTSTNGGFSGKIEEKAWEHLDDDLDNARLERRSKPPHHHLVTIKEVIPIDKEGQNEYYNVVIDIHGSGLNYHAGDLCKVIPRNAPGIIKKTLESLHANGDEEIMLDRRWRYFLIGFNNDVPEKYPLTELIALANLRPLNPVVGRRLHKLWPTQKLKNALDQKLEEQLEIWEVFNMLAENKYETNRLLSAQPWEPESLLHFLLPIQPRLYSISSDPTEGYNELELTVKHVEYEDQLFNKKEYIRRGTASTFLTNRDLNRNIKVPISIVRPPRFELPANHDQDIIMFAGGSGIAPFRSFWRQRINNQSKGNNWLLLGTRTQDSVLYLDELTSLVQANKMQVDVKLSRENKIYTTSQIGGNQILEEKEKPKGYLSDYIRSPERGKVLWRELSDENGAVVYICGQSGFAKSVINAIRDIIGQYKSENTKYAALENQRIISMLLANKRIMLDVFTSYVPLRKDNGSNEQREFDISEIAAHNNDQEGYWFIIENRVYNITDYLLIHPGGNRILLLNAGLDATHSYKKVEHHLNPDIHAMLNLFKIGIVRHIPFPKSWGVALLKQGPRTIFLDEAYRLWVRYLFSIVEQENILRNNMEIKHIMTVHGENADNPSKLKAHVMLDNCARFDRDNLDELLGEFLNTVWQYSIGLFDNNQSISYLEEQLRQVRSKDNAKLPFKIQQECFRLLSLPSELDKAYHLIQEMQETSLSFLGEIKQNLICGMRLFENHPEHLIDEYAFELIDVLTNIPDVLGKYYLNYEKIEK